MVTKVLFMMFCLLKKLTSVALDVLKKEPYTLQNSAEDLRTLENILTTPHTDSNSAEVCNRMSQARYTKQSD